MSSTFDHAARARQFARGLAYRLRNPLTTVKLLVQSSHSRRKGIALSETDQLVAIQAIDRLESLASQFLEFAEPLSLEFDWIDLRAVVESAVRAASGRANQAGVCVQVALPQNIVSAYADGKQLFHGVTLLLANALDAVGGEGQIRVTLGSDSQRQGWVTTEIADNGRGIPPGVRPYLFEPFVSDKETGIGLSLAVCRRIVEAHGGAIEALDRPGGGAMFRIRMPTDSR